MLRVRPYTDVDVMRLLLSFRAMLPAFGVLLCVGGVAAAQELPSPAAQAQLLTLLEQRALYRDRVDWAQARADLKAADTPAKTRAVLDGILLRSSAGHGRWISPRALTAMSPQAQSLQSTMLQPPAATTATTAPDGRLGWVAVGAYLNDPALTEQAQYEAMKQAAIALQARIRDQDDGQRCGWIVDLRGNSGGNMWPMLLGIGPLLGDAGAARNVGRFLDGTTQKTWAYREGGVWNGDAHVLGSRHTRYALRDPHAPVAVLVGPRTGSAGEAITLALRGRPATRSFGQPTAGYATANMSPTLVDGSRLVLTMALMQDRTGQGDGGPITPDASVAEGADPATAARDWLRAQPACRDALSRPAPR